MILERGLLKSLKRVFKTLFFYILIKRTSEYNIFDNSIIKLLKEDLFTLIDKSREHKFWQENEDKIVNGTSDVKYKLEDILS